MVVERLRQVHTLVIETNHDEKLLQNDPHRPWPVKQRIQSRHGHLSNTAAATVIEQLLSGKLERVVLGHLSRDCNTPELAAGAIRAMLAQRGRAEIEVHCAGRRRSVSDFGSGKRSVARSSRRSTAFFSKRHRSHCSMIIRDAVEADLPAIVEIYNDAIRGRISTAQLDPVTVEERLPWFREHSPASHPLWVAESDGLIAGWLSFQSFITRCAYRGTAEVSVYVSQKFRRAGVARALLEKAIAHSPSLEINALVGCIFGHNEPSLRLFERLGFERWGVLPRIARVDEVERDLVMVGRHIAAG